MNIKSLLKISFIFIIGCSFASLAKPLPVKANAGKSIKFYPAIAILSSQYFPAGNPFTRVTLTAASKVTAQTQYYVTIDFYSNPSLSSTFTVYNQLIYVNAGSQVGDADIFGQPQSYGISGYSLVYAYP